MRSYHQQISLINNNRYIHDIKAPLFKYIHDINNNKQEKITVVETLDYSFFSHPTHKHAPSHYHLTRHQGINKKNTSELSKYFKVRQNGSELHPGIEDKLMHSTWEHIHAAIRCARLGGECDAKMHTDIASYAYRELAHYLSEEEYAEFTSEISHQLGRLFNS
jgi:hypothetical protein